MTLKWNRESILVILMAVMLLIGGFYYGSIYLLDPIEEEADILTDTVETQQALVATYPPNEELYNEYKSKYTETKDFLPIGVEINKELVRLEQLAGQSDITIQSLTRNISRQVAEGLPENFYKNTYMVEMTSNSPVDFRQLLNDLTNEERVWNITSFTYNKSGDENYTGSFNFELVYYLNSTE